MKMSSMMIIHDIRNIVTYPGAIPKGKLAPKPIKNVAIMLTMAVPTINWLRNVFTQIIYSASLSQVGSLSVGVHSQVPPLSLIIDALTDMM